MLDLEEIEKNRIDNVTQVVVKVKTATASDSPYQPFGLLGGNASAIPSQLLDGLVAEVERLRALVKDAYLEGYGQTGAWNRRESSWNDSEAKTKL